MSLRQPCREWKAGGSCRFAQRCRFQHERLDLACAKPLVPEHSTISLSNASNPLITAASGSAVRLAPLDARSWEQLLREKNAIFREEFFRRFLLAIIRPLCPHQAAALAQNFKSGTWGSYKVLEHLNSSHALKQLDAGGSCSMAELQRNFGFCSSGDMLRQIVRQQISARLSIQASQDLGFVRLARLCHIEQRRLSGHIDVTDNVLFDVGAFWECISCRFSNENMERPNCAACGGLRAALGHLEVRFKQPLTAQEVLKKMRKLRKKLNQVGKSDSCTCFGQ